MVKFLSEEWFTQVKQFQDAAGNLNAPKAMAALTVNLTIEQPDGNVEMAMNGGSIQKGFLQTADVDMLMPVDYAFKLLVKGDWSVGMKGYIKRKIKVSGALRKMLPIQTSYHPSETQEQVRKKIESITDPMEIDI
jgi:hypothetical protein